MDVDQREGGFIKLHRRLRSSALYRSMSGEQRIVLVTVLFLANWKRTTIQYAGRWCAVERGEFFHSLETVAEEAGVSVKVVRTAFRKMFTDDSRVGGRGSFLTERWLGTAPGRGLRVLKVRHYDEYQAVEDEAGTPVGTSRARQGHAGGTPGAPREEKEEEEEVEEERSRARGEGVLAALVEEFRGTRGSVYGWTSPEQRRADVEASAAVLQAAGGDLEEVRARWSAALLHEGFPRVDTVADLARFWARFAPSPAEARARLRQQADEAERRKRDEDTRRWLETQDRGGGEVG